MKRVISLVFSIFLITVMVGCSNIWIAIPLSPTYKIDLSNPYMFEGKDSIYYAPYLFEQTGEYGGKEKQPSYLRLGQLAIWTGKGKKMYMITTDGMYYLLDQEADELTRSEELNTFSEEAQKIFEKLEAHPELYADIQEMEPGKQYSLNGRGQVDLEDLE